MAEEENVQIEEMLSESMAEEQPTENAEDENSKDKNQKRKTVTAKVKHARLPLGRIKQIIKMDQDVNIVSAESVFLITKATELFIEALSKDAYASLATTKMKTLLGRHVDAAISNSDSLLFLEGALDF